MKMLCYVRADKSVAIGNLNPVFVALMMGAGFGWNQEQIDYEINKWVNPPELTPQQIKEGHARNPLTLPVATAYVNGLANGGLTEDQAIEVIRAKDQPADCTECHVMDDALLPAEQAERGSGTDFRDAWEHGPLGIGHNMTKARAIHMNRIRAVRNAELAKEDITFMRAVEAGDASAQSTVATKKQVLRDIPATFDITTGVDTPEKLKAKWPTELPARE